jgi:hypothetical protein
LRIFLTVLLLFAIVVIECAVGGTRLVFSIPSYSVLGLAAVASIFRRSVVTGKPSVVCLVTSAVFFGYVLWRAIYSPVEYFAWSDLYMVLGCLAVYYLTSLHLTGTRERTVILWTLFILAALEVFIGLRQFSVGDNWMPFGFIRRDSGRRASGMLISSIHLAGLLEAIAPFALAFAFWSTWKTWKRILAGYIALLCYVGIAVTGSRGGYLSSLFSLIVFVAISLHARQKTRPGTFRRTAVLTLLGIIGAVCIAVLLMSQSILLRQRLSMIPQQLEKNGLDIRIYNWQAALDQFKVSPGSVLEQARTSTGVATTAARRCRPTRFTRTATISNSSPNMAFSAQQGWPFSSPYISAAAGETIAQSCEQTSLRSRSMSPRAMTL